MSKNYFNYGLNNQYRKRWRELKNKIKDSLKANVTHDAREIQEFHKLDFQKNAKLDHPFGIVLSKQSFIKALYGSESSNFVETEASKSWDFMIANTCYDEERNEIYPLFTFCSGDRYTSYAEVSNPLEGGGGEGYKNGVTPPPM